ncbi:hypothetical protein DSC91_002611 [Paraburkholderia caffeinilytica]|uniref:Uncharacterized protein n=1 Tax=Paraburkholderia caffeinilytica TaxID=1761016 RepID=A0ABQ1MLU1_9BURK|nr:hypothetical protein [Paraburkholderia caffeinilytica]AXL50417.1 hypothetical protein DSC91_002611 [Paraburkholderia caffeinilytica]GGC42904.1 hypothetical protein GCM10011400_32330 [Paraburkholderia caffeinilytica]CAB3790715.1 hypothetical protein LMG28690_03152 [Paraburkholderia caffeinilytica]
MSFQWDPSIPDEWPEAERLSAWVFVALFFVIEGGALLITVLSWPRGAPIASEKFMRDAVLLPLLLWLTLGSWLYAMAYDSVAFGNAVRNAARWHLVTDWQRSSRAGLPILDSVILTPEPDLALRMLGLEGKAPENPGRVMALDDVAATEGVSRVSALAGKLMTPLVPMLARAMRDDSFDIVMQCDRQEVAGEIQAAWERLELPGKPRIRWMDNSREIDFAKFWIDDDHKPLSFTHYVSEQTPGYRLLLAWHLNEAAQAEPAMSEAAVALLVASPALMSERNRPRPQAWLLRQIVSDADQVDRSLGLLLKAEQVPADRIHHFWHGRLKGLAQHATMGALRDSGLTLAAHELEQAVGPQAPVAHWAVQALAAKMAHYGQGPQLMALPSEQGVVLNLAAKEASSVSVPWKRTYEPDLFSGAELIMFISLWAFGLLLSTDKTWDTSQTVFTCFIFVLIVLNVIRRFWSHRVLVHDFWDRYGGQS